MTANRYHFEKGGIPMAYCTQCGAAAPQRTESPATRTKTDRPKPVGFLLYVWFYLFGSLRFMRLTRLICRSKSPLDMSSLNTYCIKVGTVQE